MTMKDLKILEKAVGMFKDYEHGKLKNVKGAEIDELLKESREYVKKMKEVRVNLEKKMQEHQAEKIDEAVFNLMKKIFGSRSREGLIEELDKEMVRKGKISERMLSVARDLLKLKQKVKSKKLTQSEMHRYSRDASELIDDLTEYSQRKELVSIERGIMQISVGEVKVEIVATDSGIFAVSREWIKKISEKKLIESNKGEFEEALKKTKDRLKFTMSSGVMDIFRKELGNFEIVF